MKRLILLTFLLLAASSAFAQDIITKRDGTDVKARISEVGTNVVKYKYYTNLNGPDYTIAKSDILMITYENGERDVFDTPSQSQKAGTDGPMTLDRWTGRLAINGMTIDKKSTHLYLSPEVNALYKKGDTISSVGDFLIALGLGGAVGYLVGSLASGNTQSGAAVYGVCAGLAVIGLPLHIVGLNQINSAISEYNASHGYAHNTPTVTVGATPSGIGLALNF